MMSLSVPSVQHGVDDSLGSRSPDMRCVICFKYFKGIRGLNIHMGIKHRDRVSPSVSPIPNSRVSVAPDIGGLQNDSPDLPLWQRMGHLKTNISVVKRIPRGARFAVASALSKCIDSVVLKNDGAGWEDLLTFAYRTLHVNNDGLSGSLTKKIKANCASPSSLDDFDLVSKRPNNSNVLKSIENKVNDGDLKGAAQLLFSNDALAPDNEETLSALRSKHPAPTVSAPLPVPPTGCDASPVVTEDDVRDALMSFKSGSAAGLDGLSPQHLKDLIGGSLGDVGKTLMVSLVSLVNLMLSGKVNHEFTDLFYGASLVALNKKDGGIRPIAVGNTFRRLASKICCKNVRAFLSSKFEPKQLGFAIKGGCEAAVHATREFLELAGGEVLLKVDIKNAFNTIDRGVLLSAVRERGGELATLAETIHN
ncbi:hypothetical protein O0L34_g6708 [Tuta absoluta]|nr:hypothetical protein O0L34_g6708 [Tuta absoluta]